MKRYTKYFLALIFFLNVPLNCNNIVDVVQKEDLLSKKENFKKIKLLQLDTKRIEQRYLYYKKLAIKSKKFRRFVYIAGAGATLGLLTYLSFRFFGLNFSKNDKDLSGNKKTENASGSNKKTLPPENCGKYKKRILQDQGFWGLCKYYFSKGISKGFYLGMAGVVASSIYSLRNSLFGNFNQKFFDLWGGQDEKLFLQAQRMLTINLKIFRSFLDNDIVCDIEEIKDNYAIFIEAIENFIALCTYSAEQFLDTKSQSYKSILNSNDLLAVRVVAFTQELEEVLNKKDLFDQDLANLIKFSFKQLNKQIVRFINLYYSVVYESKNLS